MEAIFGIVYFNKSVSVVREHLKKMASILETDSIDIYIDQNLGLGMTRSTIDQEAQSARISYNKNKSIWVAINGEIDNYEELKNDIEKKGHHLTQGGDAELVCYLYQDESIHFASKLRGIFNVALWDKSENKLVLICDKSAGVKPLYYCQVERTVIFGSAIKTILVNPDVRREVNTKALRELFTLGFVTAPETLFKNIYVLDGGSYLECKNGQIRIGKYWSREFKTTPVIDLDQKEREYFDALKDSIISSFSGDRKIGVLLSGGIDSSAIIGILSALGHQSIKTFSFHLGDDPLKNELEDARFIAKWFGTDHEEVSNMNATCMDLLPEMIWYLESPGCNIHPTFWLSRIAKEHVNILVTGAGNDLIWGSPYNYLYFYKILRKLQKKYAAQAFMRYRRRMRRAIVNDLLLCPTPTERDIIKKVQRSLQDTGSLFNDIVYVECALYGDQFVDREYGKLVVDASSITLRLPYANEKLVRIIDSLPEEYRLHKRLGRAPITKYLFKRAIQKTNTLPPNIIHKKKMWMYSPTAEWLRRELKDISKRVLWDKKTMQRNYFNYKCVEMMFKEHQNNIGDHTHCLMLLVTFELWHRIFIDGEKIEKPARRLTEF